MKKNYLLLALICLSFKALSQPAVFSYTGGEQSYTVPAGVTMLGVDAIGGCGGGAYVSFGSEGPVSLGGRVQCNLAVTPGSVLYIYVGGGVTSFNWSSNNIGGFNAGGTSGTYAGAGGGATDIRLSAGTVSGNQVTPYTASNRVVIAGGGGGGGDFSAPGGLGGGLTGGVGGVNMYGYTGTAGSGGTQTGIGPSGIAGGLGYGGNGSSYSGGGGGGGLYGGNGANGYNGGGGGSSYTDPVLCTAVTHTQGYSGANGNGLVTLCVFPSAGTISGVPVLCSSGSGSTTTLSDLTGTPGGVWSSSDNSIATVDASTGIVSGVSGGVVTITYNASNGCGTAIATTTVTVNQTPDVNPSLNQTKCNGQSTTRIDFAGSVPGTLYSWTNPNTTIGIAAAGTDSILATTVTDTSNAVPVTVTFTVVPTANGCTGGSNQFEIIVNPTPIFTSTLTPASICDGTMFTYTPAASTGITTSFDWMRTAATGISEDTNWGSGDPMETLNDTTVNPVAAVYVYTLTANSCTNVQNVTVTVNPTPKLNTPLFVAICDSPNLFTYPLSSLTPGVKYAWSRVAVPGVSNPFNSGTGDTIMEYLNNTTLDPVPVAYLVTLNDTLTGCSSSTPQTVSVTVNAKPMLYPTPVVSAICDSMIFLYPLHSAITGGATFAWSRAAIGVNPATSVSGMDTIMERLIDTSASPILVQYFDTLTSIASGCKNVQIISVSVNPLPLLSSTLNPFPAGLCDSAAFNYTPASRTTGATFAWVRPYVLGIGLAAGSGMGNPDEYLKNNTNQNQLVTYVYTVTANTCSHSQNVSVMVHPTPTLSSNLSGSSCTTADVFYTPTGYVTGTTYAWQRDSVAGITPLRRSGTGVIHDTLTQTGLTPLHTIYKITLTANGCSHVQNVAWTVNPAPSYLQITTHSPSYVCANTMYQNFGVASVPPANQQYQWTATNATVWATGANKQYCLVTFNNPGTSYVTLNANVQGFGCVTNNSFQVSVGSSVSDNPEVVYFQGQFICLQTDEDSYQWGYDDNSTLDSTLLTNENNPNYINNAPDFANLHYWVMTVKNGCMQKTYYNVPAGVTNVTGAADIKVFPNPAKSVLNVEINTSVGGNYEVGIVNLLGQKMVSAIAEDHKARLNVAELPAGIYLVDCFRDGVKVAATRFVKN